MGEEQAMEIARLQKDRDVAVRWANQSVDMLKDAFFPVADALRDLEAYLRHTPHHNAPEAAAARKALRKFDDPVTQERARNAGSERFLVSPWIEELTPSNDEWVRCESVQDTYDLMKKRVRRALSIRP